ncbi:MAG: hypothetical protein LBV74_00585 [Tannerella sp.]|jgi:uridine kinase|nr:hypothetical protein [Tannerella sp.]
MKEVKKSYVSKQIVKKVIDFCLDKDYRFIFLSGNGGAGKTTLSEELVTEVKALGLNVNCIDMDEFVLDTKMRKSGKKVWTDINGKTRESEYTTSFKESYYLSAPEVIVYSLTQGKNCYFKPKKRNEFVEVNAQVAITIIEGVGSAFLEKLPQTFGIFLMCNRDVEVSRRISRARDGEQNLSREEVKRKCDERNEQFEAFILPEREKFDLELSSQEDYSLIVERDDLNVF